MVARLVARRPPTNSPVPVGLASGAVAIGIEGCLQLYVDNRPAADGTVEAGQVVVDPVEVVAAVLDWEQVENRPVMFGADSSNPEPVPMSAIPVMVQRRP